MYLFETMKEILRPRAAWALGAHSLLPERAAPAAFQAARRREWGDRCVAAAARVLSIARSSFLCITSDPIISEIIQYDLEAKERQRSRKPKHDEDDMNVLLATPDVPPDQSSSDEDSSFSSTYSSDQSDEPNVQADLSLVDSELEACVEASCSLLEYYYEERLEK